MRVFELNTFCGVKSTGRIAGEIAKLVEKDGGECRIGFGAENPSPDTQRFAFRIGNPAERKLHGAMRKLLDGEGYGSQAGTRALVAEMERFRPDVVQLHNLHGCYLNLTLLFGYLRQSGVPVVWTLHDCWPFTGHCAYFDACGCTKWQTGCERCPQQRQYPVNYGIDGSARNYAHKKALYADLKGLTLVAPCEWMKRPISRSFLWNAPVRVICNGVDLNAFKPTQSDLRARHGLQSVKLALAVASDWDNRKGLRYLVEAAERLGDEYRFVVIGLSAEQISTLPDGMLGIAHTKDALELAAWYAAADCLVNPTMEDNMPMVNLEALACGTPVAAFDTGGCAEAVGDCGEIVPKGDIGALCETIRRVCEGPKPVEACIAQADRFDSRKTFASYLELYKELCR